MCKLWTFFQEGGSSEPTEPPLRTGLDNNNQAHFVKLKIRRLQLFADSSNFKAVNITRYTVYAAT